MNISTFAHRAGISSSGVRWYEAAGILPRPARQKNGYRQYSDADLARLTMILTLRRLGLPPVEAGRLAERCFAGGADDPALTATLAHQHRRIAQQREELERLELELVDLERTMQAWTQPAEDRRWPRALNVIGLVGCLVLVATLPVVAIVAGLAMFAVGLAARVIARRDHLLGHAPG